MQPNAPQAEWIDGAITVEQSAQEARLDFIRKTYVHFLLGLMAFCVVVWGAIGSGVIEELAAAGHMNSILIGSCVGLIALSFAYRRMFASANLSTHYVAFGLTIVLQGIITAPLFWMADTFFPGQNILRDAFMLTGLGFGGLTGFVLISKKDFTFLGGMLSAATLILLGVMILGMFFGGFGGGLLMSALVLIVFAGWVLHDTSMIQKHLPLNGYVFGATMLLIDFVVMLRQVVIILMSMANND